MTDCVAHVHAAKQLCGDAKETSVTLVAKSRSVQEQLRQLEQINRQSVSASVHVDLKQISERNLSDHRAKISTGTNELLIKVLVYDITLNLNGALVRHLFSFFWSPDSPLLWKLLSFS